jgi:hypothetical protein
MSDNRFATEAVERAVELIRAGAPDLRSVLKREFPELTAMGLDRVLDLARAEIERDRKRDGRGA